VNAIVSEPAITGGVFRRRRLAVFLVGRLPAVDYGVFLLIRDGRQWRGYALAEGSHRWRLHRSRLRAVIFMSWIHEGAGDELRVISTRHGLARACLRHAAGGRIVFSPSMAWDSRTSTPM
jgi:hypothetical protein